MVFVPVSVANRIAWITAQAARKTKLGTSRRASRERSQSNPDAPRARNERHDTRFENPPTKKKIGMTCRTQVRIQPQDSTPMAWRVPITPPSQ